jgi:hypothetical protein
MTGIPDYFRCPDCRRVLLIVMDPYDPGLPAEIATKVDGHVCALTDGEPVA